MITALVLNRYYIKHEIHKFHQYLNDFNTLKHWISLLLVAKDNHFQFVPSHDLDYFCGLQRTDSRGEKKKHIEYETRSKQKREEKLSAHQLTWDHGKKSLVLIRTWVLEICVRNP